MVKGFFAEVRGISEYAALPVLRIICGALSHNVERYRVTDTVGMP